MVKTNDKPKIKKGSHLTVYTYPNGKTLLEWDDDALLRDVREAINSLETKTVKKTKSTKRKKENI